MPRQASAPRNPDAGSNRVFVINKIPAGLTITHPEGAFFDKKRADGENVMPQQTVNLNGAHDEALRRGLDPTPSLAENYFGITEVDGEWFEDWKKHHSDFPPLRDGLIEAFPSRDAAKAAAKERIRERTGYEPLKMPLSSSDKKVDDRVSGNMSDQVDFQADDNKE
jgi:hypothetical protein